MNPKHTNPYKTIPGHTYAMKAEGSDQYIWGQVLGHLPNGDVSIAVRVRSGPVDLKSWSLPHGATLTIPEDRLEAIPEPEDLLPLKTWATYSHMANHHVVPMAEWPSHQMAGDCICQPIIEYHGAGTVVIHNSLDPQYPGQSREHFKSSAKVRPN